jgi:tetratricopeptide (TPR) repeat protein
MGFIRHFRALRLRRELHRSSLRRAIVWSLALLAIECSGCAFPFRDGAVPKSVENARQLSQRGMSAMERGEWDTAETLLVQATHTCPADAEARRQYAEILWHRGAKAEALAQLEDALKLSRNNADLEIRLGEMELELGKPDEARKRAERALALEPKSARAWALHGRALQAAADTPEALADFQRALGYRRDDRQLLLETAEAYRQAGQPQRALVTLQTLLDTYAPGDEPQSPLRLQGLALTALGRYDDASDSFVLALQRGPPTAELACNLAETKLLAKRPLEAQKCLEQALVLDPKYRPGQQLLERIRVAQQASTQMR